MRREERYTAMNDTPARPATEGPRTNARWRSTCAIRLVRVWTRVYTWHLRPDLQERRRAEIESDLWECAQDPERRRGASPAWEMVVRLLRGMPHDLSWRVEQSDLMAARPQLRLAATAAMSAATLAIVLGALWLAPLLRPATLPRPLSPAASLGRLLPPLPCLPAGAAGPGDSTHTWPKDRTGS